MITKISDSNPYKILKERLQIQALVDLIHDYVTYHQDLFFSLRGGIPFPKLELTSVILKREHGEPPRAFSYPFVLFSKTIYSITTGESRPLPPNPSEDLQQSICTSEMRDGLLMRSAYGAIASHSKLIVSFYRIEDLCLLCTTVFQFDQVYECDPECTFFSKTRCVFNLPDQGYRFMNPQTGVFLPPPFRINPNKSYEFYELSEEGAIYSETEHYAHLKNIYFTYGAFSHHLTTFGYGRHPTTLLGSHLVLERADYFESYQITTKSLGRLVGLGTPDDLFVDHNWVLFTDYINCNFILSLSKLVRAKENSSPIVPSFGGCLIA